MDEKPLSLAEAFIKLNQSLLKMILAINRAKLALDKLLRLKYRQAGYPFGESEEGLLKWRDYLAEQYSLGRREAPFAGFSENHSRVRDPSDCLVDTLKEEIKKRLN
jgi:hypothetical protein